MIAMTETATPTTPTTAETPQAQEEASSPTTEPKYGFWWGTGRRKSAVARVRIRPGDGKIQINNRSVEEYFTEIQDRTDVPGPLKATNTEGKIDVFVNVRGGGMTGQAGAVVLGLARALKLYDHSLDHPLRKAGYLTVDSRRVERKKYGQRGARRRFQFSKR